MTFDGDAGWTHERLVLATVDEHRAVIWTGDGDLSAPVTTPVSGDARQVLPVGVGEGVRPSAPHRVRSRTAPAALKTEI